VGRRTAPRAAPSLLALGLSTFPGASGLAALPEAEAQVRRIGPLYGPGRAAVYVGAEAREDRFKSDAARYSVLHLASHGVLDAASPLYSHVVLAPGAGTDEDGLLEAWEIMEMRLDADVVVLSACDTGRGRIAPGEGVVGTQWALFVAGARAMVVSQWPVESASTTELMTALHRGLASGTGAKAEHLRAASLALLHTPRYAHPFYWAGFVLVGDPS
jgi:CHAT domain-containing protein